MSTYINVLTYVYRLEKIGEEERFEEREKELAKQMKQPKVKLSIRRVEARSNVKRPNLMFSCFLDGLGVSMVDATPKELMYMSLQNVKLIYELDYIS